MGDRTGAYDRSPGILLGDAAERHRNIPERLTKAEASKLIDELQSESGRVRASE